MNALKPGTLIELHSKSLNTHSGQLQAVVVELRPRLCMCRLLTEIPPLVCSSHTWVLHVKWLSGGVPHVVLVDALVLQVLHLSEVI